MQKAIQIRARRSRRRTRRNNQWMRHEDEEGKNFKMYYLVLYYLPIVFFNCYII
jgi:hypothetical protein